MFRVSQLPSSAVLKTAPAASGTGHTTCTATPLQRGLIGTGLYESSQQIGKLSAYKTSNTEQDESLKTSSYPCSSAPNFCDHIHQLNGHNLK